MPRDHSVELIDAVEEFIEDLRAGKPLRRNTVTIAPPPEYTARKIARIRKRLGCSQPVFAGLIGVSTDAVQAWEQGRTISPASCRLIQVAEKVPAALYRCAFSTSRKVSRAKAKKKLAKSKRR